MSLGNGHHDFNDFWHGKENPEPTNPPLRDVERKSGNYSSDENHLSGSRNIPIKWVSNIDDNGKEVNSTSKLSESSPTSTSTISHTSRSSHSIRTKSSRQALLDELDRLHFSYNDLPGSGDCLFQALSFQTWDSAKEFSKMRSIIADEIEDNRGLYEQDIIASEEPYGANDLSTEDDKDALFYAYIRRIRREGEVGDAICIAAFAKIFGVNVRVFIYDKRRQALSDFTIEPPSLESSQTMDEERRTRPTRYLACEHAAGRCSQLLPDLEEQVSPFTPMATKAVGVSDPINAIPSICSSSKHPTKMTNVSQVQRPDVADFQPHQPLSTNSDINSVSNESALEYHPRPSHEDVIHLDECSSSQHAKPHNPILEPASAITLDPSVAEDFTQISPETRRKRQRKVQATKWKLVTSYAFTTWNLRMNEWAIAIFLTYIFPSSLLEVSLYGFLVLLIALLAGSTVGHVLDRTSRLLAIRICLAVQKLCIGTSAIVLWIIASRYGVQDNGASNHSGSHHTAAVYGLFAVVTLVGIVLRLAEMGGSIAIEKDWVVTVAGDYNTHLRRIDLISKIAAPLAVSGVTALVSSTPITMLVVAGFSIATVPVEWVLMTRVYIACPALALGKEQPDEAKDKVSANKETQPDREDMKAAGNSGLPDGGDAGSVCVTINHDTSDEAKERSAAPGGSADQQQNHEDEIVRQPHEEAESAMPAVSKDKSDNAKDPHLLRKHENVIQDLLRYLRHPIALSSIAYAQLYLTVLSFSAVMIAYLVTKGYSPSLIAGMRGVAVIAGLTATWGMPYMVAHIGLLRTGLWALWSQALSLIPVLVSFWLMMGAVDIPHSATINAVLLFGGITLSRFGLWTFDLVHMQIMQERVGVWEMGVVNGVQHSMTNFFEICALALTMIWSDPSSFWIPAIVSFAAVLSASITFSVFSWRERGHLFHFDRVRERMAHGGALMGMSVGFTLGFIYGGFTVLR
ncbi:hypothetical protein HK102_013881 [Quaeritorhiza haematococci]|nr:hypothetical protein HK102_013881 [Quaeritorhiza haematococci]